MGFRSPARRHSERRNFDGIHWLIVPFGRRLWDAMTVDGRNRATYTSEAQAIAHVRRHDGALGFTL